MTTIMCGGTKVITDDGRVFDLPKKPGESVYIIGTGGLRVMTPEEIERREKTRPRSYDLSLQEDRDRLLRYYVAGSPKGFSYWAVLLAGFLYLTCGGAFAALVGEVSDRGWSDGKGRPVINISRSSYLDWNFEYASLRGVEAKTRPMHLAADCFVGDASGEHGSNSKPSLPKGRFIVLQVTQAAFTKSLIEEICCRFDLSVSLFYETLNRVPELGGAPNSFDQLSLPGQDGIAVISEWTVGFGWLLSAELPDRVRIEVINISEDKSSLYVHCRSRRVSDIRDIVLGKSHYPVSGCELSHICYRHAVYENPCTLRERHLIHLPLHRFCLISHDCDLIGKGLVPAFASGPHLVQLAGKDYVLGNADSDRDDSQKSNRPGSAGGAPGGSISGWLLLLFGAALLKVALDSTDAPANTAWLLIAASVVGIFGSLAVCQGTVLILTGQWLL